MPYNMCQPTRDGIHSSTHIVQPVIFDKGFEPVVGQAVSLSKNTPISGTPEVIDFNAGIFYGFVQEILKGGYGSVVRATEGCFVQLEDGQEPKAGDLLYVTNDNKAATDLGFPMNGFFLGGASESYMPDGTLVRSAEISIGYGRSMQEAEHIPPSAASASKATTTKTTKDK